ncbi:MAG: DUF7446 family protein [Aeromonas veronii]
MPRIKTMGASPLSGSIYYGTCDTEKGMWVGKKTDVTDMAIKAVAEHFMVKKYSRAFGLQDGKFLVLSAKVVDELPEEFTESWGSN